MKLIAKLIRAALTVTATSALFLSIFVLLTWGNIDLRGPPFVTALVIGFLAAIAAWRKESMAARKSEKSR